MESARVSWVMRLVRGATAGAAATLLAFVSLLAPAPLFALHNNPTALEDGNLCSDCHNMSSNPGAVDAQTSYLITNSRALWNIKDANSGTTPDAIGCVYCHFNNSGTTMKGVSNHWTATSRHPIGETFNGTFTTHVNTKNEWLSNYVGDTSLASGELDCVDCHTPALVDDPGNADHTTHVSRATRITNGNLYMLNSVTVAGQYDAFCRTCHGNAVATYKGFDIRIKSHKDGSDVGANAITEADGTVVKTMEGGTVDGVPQLQTSQCTVCHDEHYSNNAVLFNDGKKDAAVVPSDCTTVCHYAGDYTDNYNRHGHGKATSTYQVGGIFKDLALACTQCHGNLEVGNPGTRKKHAEKTPTGTMQEQYQKRYNLTSKPQTADAGSVSGNPVWGICITCHALGTYKAHYSAEGEAIGCQDCHDEHAEGSGPTSNMFMIPEKSRPTGTYNTPDPAHLRAGTETVFYTTTYLNPATMLPNGSTYEFYRADGNGVCDNMECHGATTTASRPGPLSTLMAGSNHSGGNQVPNIDCTSCHTHKDSFRVGCTGCHGNTVAGNNWPDSTAEHGSAYPNRLGDHTTHINAIALARWGAGATLAQKNSTCDTCHPGTAGAGGHDTNTGGSLANAADVHGDPANTATSFKNIAGVGNSLSTDTYNNAVAANGKSCANVDCHYRVTSPTSGTATADGDGWYQPSLIASVNCASCHGNGVAGAALPNSHPVHVNAANKAFGCWYCHPSGVNNATYTTSHQTGIVNISFATTLDPATGGPRAELYSGAATPTRPVSYGAGPFATCTVTYCHGNFTNGKPANAPTWGTVASGDCGSCHDADGSIPAFPTIIASGNHTDHLNAAYGPNFGNASCAVSGLTGCHTAALVSTATHVDGSIQFDNVAAAPAASPLGALSVTVPTATDTDRCTYCHGQATVNATVGTVLAKTNWATGAYLEPCLNCHAGVGAATQNADGTGMAAPNELGDDTAYGAEVKGHNRPTAAGGYTDADSIVTNVAANKTCTDCHSAAVAHINGVNDTTYAGQRLLATINGVATGSTVTGACYACHATGGTTPATSLVSTHGNTNAAFVAPAKDANAEAFAYMCNACHNVHGMTNGTGYNNIYMIKPTIGVGNSFTTAPGGADVTTIANIRFERVSGVNSMDDGATTADNVCLTCHNNANRPGAGTAMRTIGGDHTGNAGGYTSNDTTKNCASCHVHNYDAVQVATPDGFAPQQCNACHSYPGLSTVGTEKILSGVHNMHVDTTTGYAYPCSACHYLYTHNQSNFVDGGVWNDTNVPIANINVRFDPARNAGTNLTYAGGDADVGTGASATHNGVCANLYCHGDNTTSQTDWVGPGAPAWGAADPARLACTACHADVPATGAHTLHANSTGAVDRSDCNLCHTSVNLIDAVSPIVATHVNNNTDVLLTWTGATSPLFVDGYCSANTCHSSAAADGRWNDPVLNCDACHYFNTAGNPSAVTNTAGTTFRVVSENSHDGHFAATGRTWSCNDCHPNNTTDTAGQASSTIGLSHLTVGAGTDAVILTNKAVPVQDNAAIDTTVVAQWWNAPADWVDAANTCANKCHNPSAAAKLSTAWGTTSTGCEFCHNTSTAPATGSHVAHMGATTLFGMTVACTSCHQNNVGNDGHMSGTVNLANMTALTYSGTVGIPYGAPFGTCTTSTCHNNGLAAAVASPTWGVVSADCTICHTATPATPANGAHADHMAIPTYACGDCHAAATAATHIDNTVTIKAGLTYSGTVVVGDAGYGSCSTGSCHNATTNIVWNVAAATCDQCHLGAADLTGWNGQDKSASMMNTTEWNGVGHGAKTVPCANCHDLAATAHDTTTTLSGANPFRLKDQNGAAGIQFSCSYNAAGCHVTGTTGPRTGLDISTFVTHSSAALTAAGYTPKRTWHFATPECMNCHDPHGDGANLSMISAAVYDKASFNLPAGPPPAYPTEKTNLGFTDDVTGMNAAATTYADSDVDFSGLCQECHEQATASGGVVAWHDGAAGTGTGGTQNLAPHTATSDCGGCHKHDTAFKPSGCDGCHGNGAGSNWPDSNPSNVYEDRAGSHAVHIAAIGAAQPADAGNNSCDYCHPGIPPAGHSTDVSTGASQAEVTRMSTDGTYVGPPTAGDYWIRDVSSTATAGGNLVYFKTFAAANDTDAFYNSTAKTCSNIDCHGGTITPNWLAGAADAAGPIFSPNNTITVTNPVSDGELQVSWNAATDAGTPPVRYDLYWQAGAVADACTTGAVLASNLGATSYLATGLTNGSTYSYCVKAKDSVTPTANGTNTTTANASPTAPGGSCAAGTNQNLYTNMANGSFGIDGTQAPATLGATTAYVTNGGRRPMQIGTTGLTANSIRFNTWPATATFYRAARFYLATGGICVGPNTTASQFANRTTATGDQYQFRLVDYDPAGASYNGTTIGTSANIAGTTTTTATAFNMTFAQYSVPAGHNLVLEVWNSVAATTDEARIYGGGTTGTTGTYFTTPIYTPVADGTAPVFAGLTSAVDATSGGAATLTWAAATDAFPSNPVRYTIYAYQSATLPTAGTLFVPGNIVQSNILGTTTTVTGLTNGLPYFFGARATDSANNTDAGTVIRPASAPGVTPTGGGGGGGLTCSSCHGMPPATGAHLTHSPTGPVTDCDKCHGSAVEQPSVSYTNTAPALHNDGPRAEVYLIRSMAGETNAVYTPPATDTCATTDCHYNAVTPLWASGATTCSSCHGQGANVPWPNVGSHNAHFTALGIATLTDAAAPAVCNYCHTGHGAATADHANGNKFDVTIAATFQDKSGGAMVYSGTATGTCTNVSCHGGKTTANWGTAVDATVQAGCDSCHATGNLEYNSAESGKHTAHVAALANPCTSCHSGTPVAGHFLQANLITTAMINPTTYNATNITTYTDSTTTGPPYYSAAGTSGTCTAISTGCHSGGALWDPTAVGGCNFCHGYPPTSASMPANNRHAAGATPVNHDSNIAGNVAALLSNHNDCVVCHGTKDDGSGNHAFTAPYDVATDHRDGNIEMNGPTGTGAGYNQTNWGCDGAACHATGPNDAAHNLSDSALTVEFADYGAGACPDCHAAIVTANSHLKTTKAGAAQACTACHPGGSAPGYTTRHSKNANNNIIEVTSYAAVGLNPSVSTGVHIGGDFTASKAIGSWGARPTTEAEMCWFCHDENGNAIQESTEATEWGTNFGGTYNEGTLTQARWIGATWRTAQRSAPNFGYKDGVINSVHTALTQTQGGPSSNTGDTLGQIRCSYCHDVHDRNLAVGDATTGRPYLRGQWKSSPYRQDGAPQSGTVYWNTSAGGTLWGNVPRGTSKTGQSMGGYWIDQNSGSPASAWTADQFGGLCALCHAGTPGTDQSWSAAEIDAINVFGTNGAGWVSTLNGHANSVKGGSGAGGNALRNIFNARGGSTTNGSSNPYQHFQGMNQPGNGSDGFRGAQSQYAWQPAMAGCPQKTSSDEWVVDESGGAVTNNYHQFPCSKCHVPHASRLPRLMKTNCLDTKHNTWDNVYPTAAALATAGTNNTGRSPSNWTSAQNCHRLGGVDPSDTRADVAGTGAGWNTVTPW